MTEQQKIRFLRQHVKPVDQAVSGPIVIVAGDNRSAQYLFKLLENTRYGDIRMLLPGMTADERLPVEEWFTTAESPVLICTEYEAPIFQLSQHGGRSTKIIYWQPPASVDAVLGHVYAANSENDPVTEAYLLYTKEDYAQFVSRYKRQSETDPDAQFRLFSLKRYRQWVLSQSCRRQTMAAYYTGRVLAEVLPCGVCDRCTQKPKNLLQRLMEYVLY